MKLGLKYIKLNRNEKEKEEDNIRHATQQLATTNDENA